LKRWQPCQKHGDLCDHSPESVRIAKGSSASPCMPHQPLLHLCALRPASQTLPPPHCTPHVAGPTCGFCPTHRYPKSLSQVLVWLKESVRPPNPSGGRRTRSRVRASASSASTGFHQKVVEAMSLVRLVFLPFVRAGDAVARRLCAQFETTMRHVLPVTPAGLHEQGLRYAVWCGCRRSVARC